MIRNIVLILILTLIAVSLGMGEDYYVATTGNDSTGDGSLSKSWKTITHALAVLDGTPSNPHVIHVGPGTYSLSQTGETYPLVMKSYISLQGAGDSLTILDGAFKYRIIQCNSVTEIKINGFTIKRGTKESGAGILIGYSSFITISNNIITKNRALGFNVAGGGLSAYNSSYLLIIQNEFINNLSEADAAVGGGLTLYDVTHCIISNNMIKSNICYTLYGGLGGGIFCDSSDPIIRNNTIESNSADWIGGGISCNSSALIIRNSINNNVAGGFYDSWGGGVALSGASMIGNSIGNGNNIHDNTAEDSPGYQGQGNQLSNGRSFTIGARFNYFGDNINLSDPHEIYGNFDIDPYMLSPIVFDTSNLVTVPSPINFDTVALGKSREINVTLFNVTNSLVDSITINNIVCQNTDISLSEQTFILTPAGRHSIMVTLTPTIAGIFVDSLRIETNIGEFIVHMEGAVSDSTTSVENENITLPTTYILEQNYPNPFNPSTIINYQLPTQNWVTLKIYNIFGQEVRILVDGMEEAGYKSSEFDARNLASGVYYYKLTAGSFVDVKKMILIR